MHALLQKVQKYNYAFLKMSKCTFSSQILLYFFFLSYLHWLNFILLSTLKINVTVLFVQLWLQRTYGKIGLYDTDNPAWENPTYFFLQLLPCCVNQTSHYLFMEVGHETFYHVPLTDANKSCPAFNCTDSRCHI